MSRFLKNQQEMLKDEYGEIFLTNKFGALVASTSKLSTFAHGHKYWWLGCYKNGDGAVFFDDRGYDDSVGGYVLGLVVPIKKGTEIIGILKCNLNILGSVSKLISGATDKLIGKFKLIRSGGMVVIEEGFEPLSTQVHNSIFNKLKTEDSDSFILNDSGEEFLIGFSEVKLTRGEKGYGFGGTFESIDHKKGNTGESWYVICYRQMDLVLEPMLASIKSIILIGIAVILVLVMVSYLFGRKIAKPLAILDQAAQNIGKGDFDCRIDMTRNDEFGNLARSFNTMASSLKQTTTSLASLEDEMRRRKQIEEALRKSEERFKITAEETNQLLYSFDPKTGKVKWAGAVEAVTGYAHEEFQSFDADAWAEQIHPDDREMVLKVMGEALEHHTRFDAEYRFRRKDGGYIFVEEHGAFVPGGKSVPYPTVGTISNITERKRADDEKKKLEADLQRAQKMEAIGLMAGGVAHDLNNILSGIVSYPELLLMDLPKDSPLRKPIETIKESGMKAADVVADLLTIARGVATGKEVLNLNTIVREYLVSAEHQRLEKMRALVDFKSEVDPELLNMRGSPTHIKKTLMNLVVNASEAIEDRGTVTISTLNRYLDEPLKGYEDVRIGEYAVLTVSDDGSGISGEDLDRIFEPFYTKKVMERSGTGLGLAVVWNTVQDHNGYIDVKSSEKGTLFELYFPVTREDITAEKEEVPLEDYLGHGEKILVVDDEEGQREIACGMLAKLGYHAEAVSSGEEAVAYVKENPVDLIILDMVMPRGINGREAYEEIIKIRPGQKAIIASGYAKTKEVDLAQELGAGKYIKKPYTLAKVGIAVKEELEK